MLFKTILALTITSAVGLECTLTNDDGCATDMCNAQDDDLGLLQTCMECKAGDLRGGSNLYGGAIGTTNASGYAAMAPYDQGAGLFQNGGPTVCLEKATPAVCQALDNCEDCNAMNGGALLTLGDDSSIINIALIQCMWCVEGANAGCQANMDFGYDPAGVPGAQMSLTSPFPIDLTGGDGSDEAKAAAANAAMLLMGFKGTCPAAVNSTLDYPFNVTAVDFTNAFGCCASSQFLGFETCCDDGQTPVSGVCPDPEDDNADNEDDGASSLVIGASILLAFSALF